MKKAAALVAAALALVAPATASAGRIAYVANSNDNTLTPIDTATNTAGGPIAVPGSQPEAIAITPDGQTAYVANIGTSTFTPIDLGTNTPGTPILVGDFPDAIAITPDVTKAYVTNGLDDDVTPIDLSTNTAGIPIPVGSGPIGIAITPDGATAYVSNQFDATVTPINLSTGMPGTTISVGLFPAGIAITPNGATAYVANNVSDDISVIATATNTVTTTIAGGNAPIAVAITPDGTKAYVPNCCSDNVTPIDTATNTAGIAIPVGTGPQAIAMTPDGTTAYVANSDSDDVTPINTATNTAGTAIPVGGSPYAVAITPDQPPAAAFTNTPAPAGSATSFNGSGSSDADGTVARYDWDFGDGATLSNGGATPSHTYAHVGTFIATLTVTDNEGCSTALIFTGQTALCNGSPVARIQHQVSILAASPTLATTASAGVVLGGQVHDTATIAGGTAPGGSVTFRLYGPDDATCSAAPAFTSSAVTVSGNGSYDSPSFIPTAAGTYRWTASYSGDSDNDPASSACNAANESVVVAKVSPTLSTTASAGIALGGQVHDTATLAGGSMPTGTIAFRLYGPDDAGCSNATVFTDTVSVGSGNGSYPSSNATPTAVGTYRWTASYSGDANNNAAASACNAAGEQVTVSPTVPGVPTGVSAVAGNAQATVSFTAPASNGGAAISSYTVTASPGGAHASGPGSPIAVTGLTNGTSYTFTVTATNSAGTGPPSAPSNSVTPQAPGAPTIASFSPTSGTVKTVVTITGTNFIGATKVKFNGIVAVFKVLPGGTQLIALVPPGATTGEITVENGVGFVISASPFTVVQPAPLPSHLHVVGTDETLPEWPALPSGHGIGLGP